METSNKNRTCQQCKFCCSETSLPEVGSEYRANCPHDVDGGEYSVKGKTECNCSIYNTEEFPDVCRKVRCMWLEGYGDEEDIPCESGIMVLPYRPGLLQVKEQYDNAWLKPKAKKAIKLISNQMDSPILIWTRDRSNGGLTPLTVLGSGVKL